MLYQIPALRKYPNVLMTVGAICIYLATILTLHFFMDKLPADEGRDYAVDGKLSKGKPRGAGIVFIVNFMLGFFIFSPVNTEYVIYVGLVFIEMMTGFLDDQAKVSWGRLKKGILDLVVSIFLATTYMFYNGHSIYLCSLKQSYELPGWLFFIGVVALVWISINVTNCADGVDGLSGTLTLVTLLSFYMTDLHFIYLGRFAFSVMFFGAALLAYLWFNANPSRCMMGDAGSRAMGIFIAVAALKSNKPVLYIPFALMLILDGGLGLFKVTFIKIFKVNPLKNIRTPLHDHVRKNLKENWSNNQVVMRFCIVQIMISFVTIYLLLR